MVAAWVGVSGSPLYIDAFAFHSKTNIADHSTETGTFGCPTNYFEISNNQRRDDVLSTSSRSSLSTR
jgi:hypothetical protein